MSVSGRIVNAATHGLVVVAALWLSGIFGCSEKDEFQNNSFVSQKPVPSTPRVHQARVAMRPWFCDVRKAWNLDAKNTSGPVGSFFMPQSMGNGAALLDANGDGKLDIYLLNSGGPEARSTNQLFIQTESGHFENKTKESHADSSGIACGVAIADVDNDGRSDIFVSEYGGLRLFLNIGEGQFRDVTHESGLTNSEWGASASFFDYDRDGRLDLVLARYVSFSPEGLCFHNDGDRDFCGPKNLAKVPAVLFHNDTVVRGEPRFSDVSESSGLASLSGAGLGVLCADFDGDTWDDIFIANDQQANYLWMNQHDGTFKEEGLLRGVATDVVGNVAANMGIAWGDVDGDGFDDLFVTHLGTELHTLWKQGPQGFFQDATATTNIVHAQRGTGFGTVLADFDLDGDLDLAWVNGRVQRGQPVDEPTVAPFWRPYAELNGLMMNDGSGQFMDVSSSNDALCGRANVARALCAGDIDNDGDIDLLVGLTDGHPLLLENIASRQGHWMTIRAMLSEQARDAYGSIITVLAKGQRWQRLVQPGSSYFSSHDPKAVFGLGSIQEIESISIRWPNGQREKFPGGTVNRHITLIQGEGSPE